MKNQPPCDGNTISSLSIPLTDLNKFTLPKPHPDLSFHNANGVVVRIQFEPELKVILTEGTNWDDAAKAFWNGVHIVMGRPVPFPEEPAK